MLTDPTTRILQIVNHDHQFEITRNKSGVEPFILNKFDLTDPDFVDKLSDLIFSDGAGADFIARCQCGETEGNNKIGLKCRICETIVSKLNLLDEDNLICKNWLSSPKELTHGWLSPKIYLILSSWLSYDRNKKSYLDDILDVDSILPFDLQDVVKGRGFAYLYENFDRLMDFFIFNHPTISQKPDSASMKHFLTLYKDRIFCHYVPILNTAINPIFIAEGNGLNKKRYTDVTADHILAAATSLSRLEFSPKKKNHMVHVERTAFKAFRDIIAYVKDSTSKYISKKKAIPRTHIFGSRFHWSVRGVIVPIIGPHLYYELHFPWKMAVNTLRVHIKGILCRKYGFNINDAACRVRSALQYIDPLVKEIMDDLIKKSPFPGIPFTWDRPPSIRDGSVTLKFCTKIKTDLDDSAVGMSPIDVALANADFDGDVIM